MQRAVFDFKRQILRLCLCLSLVFSHAHAAGGPHTARRITVLFPQLQAPYDQIFKSIVEGIDSAHPGPLRQVELNDTLEPATLAQVLKQDADEAIIALGNRSVEMLLQTNRKLNNAIAGAVLMEPNDGKKLSAISVAPNPEHLFTHLRQLTPAVKKIHVIYQQNEEQQVIEEAEIAARTLGLELIAIPTASVQELADSYWKLLRKQNPNTEALWIPHTGKSLDQAIMGRVLKEAWNRPLIVFSSNLADVRKGALFALYPDNQALGRNLVATLYARLENPDAPRSVQLSQDLLSAINIRTANHLGIYLNANELTSYRLIYPEGK